MITMSNYGNSCYVNNLAYNASTSNSLTSGPGSTTAYIISYSNNINSHNNRDWGKKGLGFNNNQSGGLILFGHIVGAGPVGCRPVI